MTEAEAKHFDRHSATNTAILESVRPDCKAYEDWFTYKRWKAQGKQVARGEKGTKIFILVKNTRKNKEGKIIEDQTPRFINVFHRHQLNN